MSRTSPPQTVLGQLQRGRGAGWLAASNSIDGADLLFQCIFSDPRLDSQVEDRADYYGSLARELELPAVAVAGAAIEDDDDARRLRMDVLAAMARRGDVNAVCLLRDLFRDDSYNDHIAYLLSEIPGGLDGMDRLITGRLDKDALATFVNWTRTMLPWDRWTDGDPLIARAISRFDAEPMAMRPKPPNLLAPLDVILAYDWGRPPDDVMNRFVHTSKGDELLQLRRAAMGPPGAARYFALNVLGARQDPCALDLAEKTFAANTSGRDRATLYRYIRVLNATDTLPLARRWLDVDDSRSGVAATLMELHSEDSDVPSIRLALDRA